MWKQVNPHKDRWLCTATSSGLISKCRWGEDAGVGGQIQGWGEVNETHLQAISWSAATSDSEAAWKMKHKDERVKEAIWAIRVGAGKWQHEAKHFSILVHFMASATVASHILK